MQTEADAPTESTMPAINIEANQCWKQGPYDGPAIPMHPLIYSLCSYCILESVDRSQTHPSRFRATHRIVRDPQIDVQAPSIGE
jgi:hypothetical protein